MRTRTAYQRANHYTTARDLATLTAYAMKNREFREIVACKEHTIVSSLYPDGKVYTSKYDLLFEGKQLYYAPCIGVKTGYTNSAGRCFVGAAEQNGVTLVSVSLNTSKDDTTYSQVFTDTIRLCNYGFAQYREVSFREMFAMCDDSQLAFLVSKAAKDDANKGYLKMNVADIPDDYRESYLKKDWEDVNFQKELANSLAERLEFEFTAPLVAPISEGDILGVARYTTQSGAVLEGKIVASRSVAMEPPTMDELLDEWVDENAPWMAKLMPRRNPSARVLYLLLLAGIVTLIVLRVRRNRRRDRERRVMLEKKRREYLRRQKYLREHPEARRTSRPSASGTPARTPARKTSAVRLPKARPRGRRRESRPRRRAEEPRVRPAEPARSGRSRREEKTASGGADGVAIDARETGVAGNVRRVRACVHKRNTRVPGDAELVRMAVQRNGREAGAAVERKGRLRAALTTRRSNAR